MKKILRHSASLILLFTAVCRAESAGKKPESVIGEAAAPTISAPAISTGTPSGERKKRFKGAVFYDEERFPGGAPKWLKEKGGSGYAISGNEKRLISRGKDGSFAAYDDQRRLLWRRRKHDLKLESPANPLTNQKGDRTVVLDLTVNQGEYRTPGRFLVLDEDGKVVYERDCNTPEALERGENLESFDSLRLSPNGRYLGMRHGIDSDTFNFYDLQTGEFWQRTVKVRTGLIEVRNDGGFLGYDADNSAVLYSRSGVVVKSKKTQLNPASAFQRGEDGQLIVE